MKGCQSSNGAAVETGTEGGLAVITIGFDPEVGFPVIGLPIATLGVGMVSEDGLFIVGIRFVETVSGDSGE